MTVAYGPGARITRLNKGLRRRANRTQFGFKIDPVSGYWAKNNDEGNAATDPTAAPRQWDRSQRPGPQEYVVAAVRRRRPAAGSRGDAAACAAARNRGSVPARGGRDLGRTHAVRDERTGFLLYEATEGGAGVTDAARKRAGAHGRRGL